jgi:hypothetical protein
MYKNNTKLMKTKSQRAYEIVEELEILRKKKGEAYKTGKGTEVHDSLIKKLSREKEALFNKKPVTEIVAD